jgi:hypothetical protein
LRAGVLVLALLASACAARGHVATPDEVLRLQQSGGLSATGRITLSGPRGRFSARLVFGVAAPDSLRIEIPAGDGLRFLLVAKDGSLRAELPQDDAMFEGPATSAVMNRLFGIDLDPRDLVAALLGSPPETIKVGWRFESTRPTQMTIHGSNHTRLSVTLDDPDLQAPREEAFQFGPPRRRSWTLQEMSDRLGLRR